MGIDGIGGVGGTSPLGASFGSSPSPLTAFLEELETTIVYSGSSSFMDKAIHGLYNDKSAFNNLPNAKGEGFPIKDAVEQYCKYSPPSGPLADLVNALNGPMSAESALQAKTIAAELINNYGWQTDKGATFYGYLGMLSQGNLKTSDKDLFIRLAIEQAQRYIDSGNTGQSAIISSLSDFLQNGVYSQGYISQIVYAMDLGNFAKAEELAKELLAA